MVASQKNWTNLKYKYYDINSYSYYCNHNMFCVLCAK